jgi:uncharacterized protein YndB with AHSA1/START domain
MRDEHATSEQPSDEPERDGGGDDSGRDDGTVEVRRSVDIEADIAAVWEAVVDPSERAGWLDDPDALARHIRIDEAAPGERLVWTWWRPGDEDDASTVSVVLRPADGGGTRVTVTETLPAAVPPGGLGGLGGPGGATISASAAGASRVRLARRAPAWLRCATDRWDARLLGLELRFVPARVAVA